LSNYLLLSIRMDGLSKKNKGWCEHNLRKCNIQILFISKKIFIFFFHFRNYCNIIIFVVAGPVQLNSIWPELFSATCNLWTFGTVSYKFRFFSFIYFLLSREMLSYQLAPTMNVLSYYPDQTISWNFYYCANCYLSLVLEAIVCLVYQNVLPVCDDWMFWFGKMLEVISKYITKTYKLTW